MPLDQEGAAAEIEIDVSRGRDAVRSVTFLSPPHSERLAAIAMSSKRKWDQAAPESTPSESDHPVKAPKTDEGKTASEAAAAAAAIAAKIAAQFSAGGGIAGSIQIGQKDPHDGDFTHDIDINDVRNRYMLTKGSTQTEVRVLNSGCMVSYLLISQIDSRRNGRVSQYQGCVVPGSIKGNGEGPSIIPSPFGFKQGDVAEGN